MRCVLPSQQQGLRQIGLSLSEAELSRLYPHYVGHHLGLDVHDCTTVGAQPLPVGSVVAIEPGIDLSLSSVANSAALYFPPDSKYSDFAGIGIRVEDDVVIQENGPLVLSSNTPKEVGKPLPPGGSGGGTRWCPPFVAGAKFTHISYLPDSRIHTSVSNLDSLCSQQSV